MKEGGGRQRKKDLHEDNEEGRADHHGQHGGSLDGLGGPAREPLVEVIVVLVFTAGRPFGRVPFAPRF